MSYFSENKIRISKLLYSDTLTDFNLSTYSIDEHVSSIQEAQETKWKKVRDFIKACSIFRLNVGIFHNGTTSFIPTYALGMVALLMMAIIYQGISIALTLNTPLNEHLWNLTTQSVSSFK